MIFLVAYSWTTCEPDGKNSFYASALMMRGINKDVVRIAAKEVLAETVSNNPRRRDVEISQILPLEDAEMYAVQIDSDGIHATPERGKWRGSQEPNDAADKYRAHMVTLAYTEFMAHAVKLMPIGSSKLNGLASDASDMANSMIREWDRSLHSPQWLPVSWAIDKLGHLFDEEEGIEEEE